MENLHPVHYSIHLEPNLETFIFNARVELELKLSEPTNKISLHALDLNFEKIEILVGEEITPVPGFDVNLEEQLLNIELPKNAGTHFHLKFLYKGEHNDKMAGFYRSKFLVDGQEKYVAVTQFQANDARRAFPCVDIPGKKATFDIEFLVDKELFTISNMPIEAQDLAGEKRWVKFHRTPVMSTYLVFFGVGEFEAIEKSVGKRLYRVIASPGKAKAYGQFALDFGVKVVEHCENYFDMPYPLPKLDQIATPDFAAGAMENWGAILYRENALLYYDGITSQSMENGILSVIAHEIAHQWFGNLVSPETWKYLWLNESFATFFATKVVDHYYPEKRIFDYFVSSTNLGTRSRSTSGVMDWDAMINTSPIELYGDAAISFSAKTVPILYSKGGSILRQVEAYLGEEGFRDGLRTYFKKHAYKATKSDYLWQALEETSGKPVNKMMETWVLQKGLPLVTVERNGSSMKLSQERFTYLDHEHKEQWIIPVTIRLFKDSKEVSNHVLELDEKSKTFDLEDFDSYYINIDMTGFYRVFYPEQDFENLKKLIENKTINPIERLVVEDNLFSLLKAGKITLNRYLDFIKAYKNEDSHLSILSIAAHLYDLYNLFDEGDNKDYIKSQGKALLDSILNTIGIEPQSNESMGISIIRGTLLQIAIEFDVDDVEDFVLLQFDLIKQDKSVDPDIRGAILSIAASLTNDYDWFYDAFKNPKSESDFIQLISAMCHFSNEDSLEKVKELLFTEIPSRNRGFAINVLNSNKLMKDQVWEWFLANIDSIEALNNFMLQGAIVSVITHSERQKDEMEEFFEDYLKTRKNLADAFDVGIEQLKIKIQFKEVLKSLPILKNY
jgi:aminopeptidase N